MTKKLLDEKVDEIEKLTKQARDGASWILAETSRQQNLMRDICSNGISIENIQDFFVQCQVLNQATENYLNIVGDVVKKLGAIIITHANEVNREYEKLMSDLESFKERE